MTGREPRPDEVPARSDPARSDLARSDPARSDLARSDPARGDPARSDPARSDPAREARAELERLRDELETERATRRGLESAMHHNPDLVARFDRRYRHLFVNPAVERATGLPAEALLGRTNEELGMPPGLCRLWHATLDAVFSTGEERTIEFEFPDPEGPRVFQSRVVPEPGPDGETRTALGITREITERKRAELAARERNRQLKAGRARPRSIFQKAPAMIAVVRGPDHVYEISNPANLAAIGDRPVIGHAVREVLPELADQGLLELLDRVYATGEAFEGRETRMLVPGPSGEPPREMFLNFVYQPLFDPDGSVSGVFFHGVDVTALVRAREAAQAASRAKSEFLATISHELRTPLHAIIGYAQLLLAGIPEPLPDGSRPQVERLVVSARHLMQLIEEVLTFSRLEAAREEIRPEPVEVADLVDEVTAILGPLADEKGLTIRVEQPTPGARMTTDPRKVRQILLNVASNAVKFTEDGRIEIRAHVEADGLRFEIEDTGAGIDPADLERIFEPFWQRKPPHITEGGTGLGLSVARRFARMLGGDIEVRSATDRGSTFTIRLPLEAPDPENATGAAPPTPA